MRSYPCCATGCLLYLRQEKDGLLLGPYERHCRAHWMDSTDPMPEDFLPAVSG